MSRWAAREITDGAVFVPHKVIEAVGLAFGLPQTAHQVIDARDWIEVPRVGRHAPLQLADADPAGAAGARSGSPRLSADPLPDPGPPHGRDDAVRT